MQPDEEQEKKERQMVKRLREYYRQNFVNGVSDEAFLVWMEIKLKEIHEEEEADGEQ